MLVKANLVSGRSSGLYRQLTLHLKRSLMLYSNASRKAGLVKLPSMNSSKVYPTASSVFCMQRFSPFSVGSIYAKLDKPFNHHPLNFTSSSDFDDKSYSATLKESLLNENEIFKEDESIIHRNRFGFLKAVLIIIAGIYFGAWLAMIGAYVLEELEIFVDDDEDDD